MLDSFVMGPKNYLTIGIIALLAFVGGFLFSNSLNRFEMNQMRGELEAAKAGSNSQTGDQTGLNLTNEEIDAKIAEADANPQNFNFQKGLGLALYRYGAMKQDASIIERSINLLERANRIDPSDNDVLVALGNANFDIGYFKKENAPLTRAREYYIRALDARPTDVELRNDVALTYFLQEPPQLEKAAAEFERSLAIDPKHEKSIQFFVQTLAKQGNDTKANEMLERLKAVNPQNPFIGELRTLINSKAAEK